MLFEGFISIFCVCSYCQRIGSSVQLSELDVSLSELRIYIFLYDTHFGGCFRLVSALSVSCYIYCIFNVYIYICSKPLRFSVIVQQECHHSTKNIPIVTSSFWCTTTTSDYYQQLARATRRSQLYQWQWCSYSSADESSVRNTTTRYGRCIISTVRTAVVVATSMDCRVI